MPATLVAEAGWYRPTPPPRNPNRSLIWLYGVVYDRPAGEGRKKPERKVYCQATEECRDSNSFFAGAGTGNYSLHLEEIHQTTSDRSKGLKAKKVQTQLVLRQAVVEKQRMVYEGGEAAGHRHDKLKYVKNIVIGTFQPFNYMEHQLVRQHYKTLNPAFPVEELHHKAVRHIINELHSATQISVTQDLAMIKARALPSLAIFIDLWEDKFCAKKFLGIRVRYLDESWQMRSKLLSLRFFSPSSQLRENHQLSSLLTMWVNSCLGEYGLATRYCVGAVSDSGSDVKRCCRAKDCMHLPWEWCGPHLLNRALVDAVGWTEGGREGGREGGARGLLMEVRKVIKHISKSTTMKVLFDETHLEMYGKSLKLVLFAMNRWSSAEKCIRRVLRDFIPILRSYHTRSRRMELKNQKQALLELYSLVRSVNIIIKDLQGNAAT
jgi:hypothetical protein